MTSIMEIPRQENGEEIDRSRLQSFFQTPDKLQDVVKGD